MDEALLQTAKKRALRAGVAECCEFVRRDVFNPPEEEEETGGEEESCNNLLELICCLFICLHQK